MLFRTEVLIKPIVKTHIGSRSRLYNFEIMQISVRDFLRLMYIIDGKHPVIRRYALFYFSNIQIPFE